jgi:hypothetical protein
MQAEQIAKWGIFAGGLGTAGTLLAVGEGALPPWQLGAVWLAAVVCVTYGLGALRPEKADWNPRWRWGWRVVRTLLGLVVMWVGFSFWQAQAPRAEIRLAFHRRLDDNKIEPNQIAVNVGFKNVGKYEARYRVYAATRMINGNDVRMAGSMTAVEDNAHAALEKMVASDRSEERLLSPESTRFYTHSYPFPPNDRREFEADRAGLLVFGQIRYFDWWFFERPPTEYCFIYRGHTKAVNTCSRYNTSN